MEKGINFNDLNLRNLENDVEGIAEYRKAVELLATQKSDTSFINSGPDHATIVISQIFKYANNSVKIFAGNLGGRVANTPEYVNALKEFLSIGGKLEVLLTDFPSHKSSLAYDIISKSAEANSNITVKKINDSGLKLFRQSFNNTDYHFVVGDSHMYRLETNSESYSSYCNFNDPTTSRKLVEVFDKIFSSTDERVQELYNDLNFKNTCSIIIPDFENINLELIEHFSKHPEDLQHLDWRKFEKLLDVIFRNQGYNTQLGPGSGDGGIDLRLIQKDSIGQILTLVQAKKYKKENPIRIEAVQALSAIVQHEHANRGLFVTTSRYFPGVEKWVAEQPTKLILAKSEDIAKWCQLISENRDTLR